MAKVQGMRVLEGKKRQIERDKGKEQSREKKPGRE